MAAETKGKGKLDKKYDFVPPKKERNVMKHGKLGGKFYFFILILPLSNQASH